MTAATSHRPLPRAGGHWLWGNAREMRDRPHSFVAELGARRGGLAQLRILHRRMIAVTHPDHLRQILVTRHERYERSFHYRTPQQVVGRGLITTDGPEWKIRRRQMQTAFRPEAVRRVVPAAHAAAAEMLARWETWRRAGEPVPLLAENADLRAHHDVPCAPVGRHRVGRGAPVRRHRAGQPLPRATAQHLAVPGAALGAKPHQPRAPRHTRRA